MECTVTIEGVGKGILFHNPSGSVGKTRTAKKEIPDPQVEAENSCYWNKPKTELVFPADNIKAALIRASSGLKLPSNKKLALAPIIAGDVGISPDNVGFGTNKYEIDVRPVAVQKARILRARPWLQKWKLNFNVTWEKSTFGADFHKTLLPELLTTVGERIGIGDYRPERRGPFGRFKVVSIK